MLKYTAIYTLLIVLLSQKAMGNLTPLKAIPIPEQDLKEAEQKYKEKALKEERRQRFLASLKEIDVALLEESFEQAPGKLKTIVYGMLKKEEFTSHYKNILLTGPSGSGKSTLAEAIAFKLQRKCIVIDAPSLLGRYRDQAAENILKLFKQIAADPDKPILVINEINAFTDGHTSEHSDTQHTAMQLWTLVDKYSKDADFLLIGTTNTTKKMPHQLQSRFEGKTFLIDNSFINARLRALNFYMVKSNILKDASCTDEYLHKLIQNLDHFSTRELEALVNRAHLYSIIENADTTKKSISKENFEEAYKELIQEREQFWDFTEQTTDEERRHKENLAQNAKQFIESQNFQIKINEWSLLYQAHLKITEKNHSFDSKEALKQLNYTKSIIFPKKAATVKFKITSYKDWCGRIKTTEEIDLDGIWESNLN